MMYLILAEKFDVAVDDHLVGRELLQQGAYPQQQLSIAAAQGPATLNTG